MGIKAQNTVYYLITYFKLLHSIADFISCKRTTKRVLTILIIKKIIKA